MKFNLWFTFAYTTSVFFVAQIFANAENDFDNFARILMTKISSNNVLYLFVDCDAEILAVIRSTFDQIARQYSNNTNVNVITIPIDQRGTVLFFFFFFLYTGKIVRDVFCTRSYATVDVHAKRWPTLRRVGKFRVRCDNRTAESKWAKFTERHIPDNFTKYRSNARQRRDSHLSWR